MGSPAPVDVGDALDDLINQFSDPMSFFRELIQNALDAGSGEVEVEFEFEPSDEDPDSGAMIVNVQDFGEGMDREIIDNKLTRLFSSAKDGDMTKIGKFGIGFVSVFAIEPDAVCVDTARAGEAWRVLFDRERNFKRLRLDQALEGTTIRIIKNSTRADFERFVVRAKQVVRYWCGHAKGEVIVDGELISAPFGLDAAVRVVYEDDFSHIHIGHRPAGETLHAFFNGGLTLVQADHNHGTAIEALIGLSFKVSSRYLEHTLTRDDVIKDGHFDKVVARLEQLARGQLRERVLEELDHDIRAGHPSEPGDAATRLQVLYEAACWHLRDHAKLSRAHAKLACARSPSGRIWTWAELRKAAAKGLFFASARTPLSDAVEALGRAVLLSYGGVSEGAHRLSGPGGPSEARGAGHEPEPPKAGDEPGSELEGSELEGSELEGSVLEPLIHACKLVSGFEGAATWLVEQWFMPLAPEPAEVRQWGSLATTAQRLLDDTGHSIAGVSFGRFGESGSLLGARAAISQREFGEATPVTEAGELGKGLFARKRVLVVDADHPTVRTLLGLALREPELAAYQLVKLFLLLGGSISAASDSELADVAMGYREARCPKPLS
ncbi:heat shock protein 90 [Enhygromyxa salina]|uniref:Heat shock protein 90 n=1 Tax=Enhygromyxa salina TaxID=215803 RepID=A0A2S9XJH1_9BACT|nr:ATP-binding protein [Enhygromyxa salina]PRP93026.1 heat shock protein 90 [Enhygromyxa salina]